MEYLVSADGNTGDNDDGTAEGNAPADKSAVFRLSPRFHLSSEIEEFSVARRAVRNVFPSRITRRSRSIRQFTQNGRTRAADSFRVRELPEDRLLHNVLEFFENLIGRIVLHQSKSLWH
ncbi:MAG: hypothetical protein JOZ22_07420 [Acidobacteriia bacterium]|nr:hypothetical protein [Terriglobia bacterium]